MIHDMKIFRNESVEGLPQFYLQFLLPLYNNGTQFMYFNIPFVFGCFKSEWFGVHSYDVLVLKST